MCEMTKKLSIICLLTLIMSCVKEDPKDHIQPGESLPSFSTVTLSGERVSDKTLAGKPSLIIIFTTVCPDCQRQMPEIQAAYEESGGRVNFLAINRGEDPAKVSAYMNDNNYTLPVVAEGNRYLYNLFKRDSVAGVPQIYLSDKDGIVRHYHDDTRTIPAAEIIKEIKSLSVK